MLFPHPIVEGGGGGAISQNAHILILIIHHTSTYTHTLLLLLLGGSFAFGIWLSALVWKGGRGRGAEAGAGSRAAARRGGTGAPGPPARGAEADRRVDPRREPIKCREETRGRGQLSYGHMAVGIGPQFLFLDGPPRSPWKLEVGREELLISTHTTHDTRTKTTHARKRTSAASTGANNARACASIELELKLRVASRELCAVCGRRRHQPPVERGVSRSRE